MRGILAFAGYVPYHRLDRAAISAATGTNAGKGTRAVASYDEDTTTLATEAARLALRPLGEAGRTLPDAVWFSTTAPAYVDKTNATVVHAALRLDRDVSALDLNGAVHSAVGALQAALRGNDTVLVTAADIRTGLPTSADEREGGDAAAAVVVGEGTPEAPVLAELIGRASLTEEFLDRWRTPGDVRSKQWEERFGETHYVPLGQEAWKLALDDAGIAADQISQVIVAGTHSRAVRQVSAKVSAGTGGAGEDLAGTVGNPGAAQPTLLLAHALERSQPGEVVALVVLADGADVFVFRATDALAAHVPARPVGAQVVAGRDDLRYLQFLSWNAMVTNEPPRRPEPARASASAAARNEDWKFGFVASRDRTTGAVHMPPARVSYDGGAVDDMEPVPMADALGTIVTFTVDRLAYSPSPPIVFAVVDFDQPTGGRLPVELTDVDAADVAIGQRVELTFRRLNRSDGIQNYFWKAKPLRDEP
jgi:hydroxymethylglutaryl-CoA synthase